MSEWDPRPLETAAEPKFKPGDIALLRSGGPAMTVMKQRNDRVETLWFSTDGLCQHGVFCEPELFRVVPA